jgi:CRP-like cAMP-binding protein
MVPVAAGNKIITALPQNELTNVRRHLEDVYFEKGEVVYTIGDKIQYAYFPVQGLFSLVSNTEDGETAEIAMIGKEGIVGHSVILKNGMTSLYEVSAQASTYASRIRAEVLKEEFRKGGVLQELVLRYLNVLMAQVSQLLMCNRFHVLEKALIRWLLMAQDLGNSQSLHLTHESISQALGVPRTGVTTAAGSLQRAGLIRYSRGKIVILDRTGLEANSCECYRIIHNETQQFLKELGSRVKLNVG